MADVAPAITVESHAGAAVDDWACRPDLLASSASDTHFVVETEHDGAVTLRFGDDRHLNGRMTGRLIRRHCVLDAAGEQILRTAMDDLGLSARAHDRILRVARTIADLAAADRIDPSHVAESVGYRTLDRKLWLR